MTLITCRSLFDLSPMMHFPYLSIGLLWQETEGVNVQRFSHFCHLKSDASETGEIQSVTNKTRDNFSGSKCQHVYWDCCFLWRCGMGKKVEDLYIVKFWACPPGPIFFIFMPFSANFGQIIGCRSLLLSGWRALRNPGSAAVRGVQFPKNSKKNP